MKYYVVDAFAEKVFEGNKREMVARQLSNRGGTLYCKHEDRRVRMAGKAALYSIADINIE